MSSASVQNYREKQVIFSQGQIDRNFYKIISGKIGLYIGYGTADERMAGVTAAPRYFGAMNVFGGRPSQYTAVALEATTVLQLPEGELDTFFKNDPAGAATTMRTAAGQLAAMQQCMNVLLEGLRTADKVDAKALQDLIAQCEDFPVPALLLDDYEEYVPIAAEIPAAMVQNAEPAAAEVSSLFLEGHRGYPGVVHPEYKKYIIQVEHTCPHCMKKFRADKILTSRLIPVRDESEAMRYSLRVSYHDFEAEWYEIVTCPHCCFSSFENYFKDAKSLYRSRYEKKLEQLRNEVKPDFARERDLDFVFAQHYMALACASGMTDHRQIEARVWANLIRLYKDAGEEELTKIAEQKALDAYQTVYMECDLQPGQEQRLCLTIAGMLFARGEKRAAREWAARVRMGSGDRSAYWNMAEQLIQDVRSELAAENE